MTDKEQIPEELYRELRQLSTEELEKRLATGWSVRTRDEDAYFDAVAKVIIERDAENPCSRFADVDTAWAELEKHLLASATNVDETKNLLPKAKRKGLARRAATFAAVLAAAFACLLCAQARGLGFFGALGSWTDEIFHFEQIAAAESNLTDAAGVLPEIEAALSENGIPTALAPKGKMAGMTLLELQTCCSDEIASVELLLQGSGDTMVTYTIFRASDASLYEKLQYEKSDAPVTEYIHNGMRFYIFENTGRNIATWSDGTYNITIGGNIDRETLQRLIDSI